MTHFRTYNLTIGTSWLIFSYHITWKRHLCLDILKIIILYAYYLTFSMNVDIISFECMVLSHVTICRPHPPPFPIKFNWFIQNSYNILKRIYYKNIQDFSWFYFLWQKFDFRFSTTIATDFDKNQFLESSET